MAKDLLRSTANPRSTRRLLVIVGTLVVLSLLIAGIARWSGNALSRQDYERKTQQLPAATE